jgi:hypothetical protein
MWGYRMDPGIDIDPETKALIRQYKRTALIAQLSFVVFILSVAAVFASLFFGFFGWAALCFTLSGINLLIHIHRHSNIAVTVALMNPTGKLDPYLD